MQQKHVYIRCWWLLVVISRFSAVTNV